MYIMFNVFRYEFHLTRRCFNKHLREDMFGFGTSGRWNSPAGKTEHQTSKCGNVGSCEGWMKAAGRQWGWVHVESKPERLWDETTAGKIQKTGDKIHRSSGRREKDEPAALSLSPPLLSGLYAQHYRTLRGFRHTRISCTGLLTVRRKYQNKSLLFVFVWRAFCVAEDELLWRTAAGRAAESSTHTRTRACTRK